MCCEQVRDAACLACGKVVLAYPAEAREALPRLYERWFDHLAENIPSVRASAAAALACAAQGYGREALDVILPRLRCARIVQQQGLQPGRRVRLSALPGVIISRREDGLYVLRLCALWPAAEEISLSI